MLLRLLLLKAKSLIAKENSQKIKFFVVLFAFSFFYLANFLVFHFFISDHTLAITNSATHRQVPTPLQQTAATGKWVAKLGLP